MMSDADVDGSHIRTLLMTFFYRQMPRLVAEGHLYVAQPPLYMISAKKDRRYVQTDTAMQAILVDRGLENARLQPADTRDDTLSLGGDRLKLLHDLVVNIDHSLRAFGRRNLPLRAFLHRAHGPSDPKLDGLLPLYLVREGPEERWLYTAEELEAYRQSQAAAAPAAPGVAPEASVKAEAETETGTAPSPADDKPGSPSLQADSLSPDNVVELHEVRSLNKSLARLRDEFGMRAEVLLPIEVTGDEPPPRFVLHRDGEEHPVNDLRELVTRVRQFGEKGIKITRFKGLGEMDADQLWETTMDPTRRTLLQVRLDDAAAANDLFTTLMGDDVEPRREFIEKHALEVKNLDV
jgi:DNA gyrase subunit B